MEVTLAQSAPTYTVKNAILLYGAGGDSVDYVTLHSVVQTDEGLVIKEGHPATKPALLGMLGTLEGKVRKPLRLLDERVLAVSDDCLVWWEPEQVRRIAFDCKELGKRTVMMGHPPLLFVVFGGNWYVFALPESKRPLGSTPILRAPYFNVWDSGQICTGTTALPDNGKRDDPSAWSGAFFESAFTHSNNRNVDLVRYENGAYAFWRDMLDTAPQTFPREVLVDTGHTLDNVIAAVGKRI